MLPTIEPGLMVIHGNRPEDLRDLLVAWLQRHPLRPLENEVLLVQSNGIAQWLKLALARPFEQGGLDISAAVDVQLPGRFLWQAYRAVLGTDAVPPTSPFDKSRLVWRLLRLLPRHREDTVFEPLQALLGDTSDWRKRYELALQIADQFDQYQVYRADWLQDWERGRDVLHDALRQRTTELPLAQRWQAQLWRLLLADVGSGQRHGHRAGVHRQFMAHLEMPTPPRGLPRRIVVFGISSLPQQTLQALTGLGRWCQVLLMVSNPCRHYWADIIEDRELFRSAQRRHGNKPGLPPEPRYEDLHLHAQPLLAAWGKQGRDYIRLLDEVDRPEGYRARFTAIQRSIDLFTDLGEDCLLHQVQQSILDLTPLTEDATQRRLLDPEDDSLRFHIAHNPQRDVEILHDHLLAMFERAALRGQPLAPRDVMVMVPDIRIYAPHIQAVFGRLSIDDPRYLPYSIADQPSRGHAPLLVALERLLHLPDSRFTASDILDLLDVPSLRRRFGIREEALPTLRRWIEGAGIRWGLDGAQKHALGMPEVEQNTWRFGLRRLLLGYAVGDGASLDGIAPYAEIGGLDAALIGPLSQLLDQLERDWQLFSRPATPMQWCERLHRLLDQWFDTSADDADTMRLSRLEEALDTWQAACAEAHFAQSVPIAVVREPWLQAVDESRLSQRFMAGSVNFGTLLPMRAIPFRAICLLGMNDADYPRRSYPPDFDLMALAGHQRPGDRSRRDDDRYLFLEAVLSARDALYISWVGRSARDNSILPPSVLVSQLRDYLAAGWRVRGEDHEQPDQKSVLAAITTEYPLQAFSRCYFSGADGAAPFTYAQEWQRAHRTPSATSLAPLSPWQPDRVLDLALIQSFLRAPAALFYKERLKVFLEPPGASLDDDEPFDLDGLEKYVGTAALLHTALHGRHDAAAATLDQAMVRMHEQGTLPVGGIGALMAQSLSDDAQRVLTQRQQLLERFPQRAPSIEMRFAGAGLVVEDWLHELRVAGEGQHIRIDTTASALLEKKNIRYDKLVATWATHLLANANGVSLTTYVAATDAIVALNALPSSVAAALFDALLQTLEQGLRKPLPIARRTAFAWLLAGAKDPYLAALQCYDPQDRGHAAGEVQRDAYLARDWPNFARLHAAGFEQWLALYQPMLRWTRLEPSA